MKLSEVDVIIDYFHTSSRLILENLGVDKAKLPQRHLWHEAYRHEFSLPIDQRSSFHLIWLADKQPVGFSSADKIKLGEEAFMHLHITRSEKRRAGLGTILAKQSVRIYFETLKIRRLFCEPFAWNEAPHRTLARVGFSLVKTYETVPGPFNFYQPVIRWLLERPDFLF